jgi:DDE superfamily endonuclease
VPQRQAAVRRVLRRSSSSSLALVDHKLLPKFAAIIAQQKNVASRGAGRNAFLSEYPEIEAEAKRILSKIRFRGGTANILVVGIVVRTVLRKMQPKLLREFKTSRMWCSRWAHDHLNWSWRLKTTAASKLPLDWREQGVAAAKRVAYQMQVHKVHPSLVVNADQTGLHLVPADSHTYAEKGSKEVSVIGAEDKRQITVVVASSMDGNLLPLQLIFQGKTAACHPSSTDASRSANVHITHSENHWSNQETMRQWITEVLLPYADRQMLKHIHLVFVPPNCTSKLQVADVILQRPFKHGVRRRFTEWATDILQQQIESDDLIGLSPYFKMSVIKPNILQWCIDSWKRMQEGEGAAYIKMGWHSCCSVLYNVHDIAKRIQVVEAVAKGELDGNFVPKRGNGSEATREDIQALQSDESGSESDEDGDELDVLKVRQFGTRKSERKRKDAPIFGYQINSQQMAFTSGSEA